MALQIKAGIASKEDTWKRQSQGKTLCVVQVAQLELEAQRVQLEQEDAAESQASPEALQRLQQQVSVACFAVINADAFWSPPMCRQLAAAVCKPPHRQHDTDMGNQQFAYLGGPLHHCQIAFASNRGEDIGC